MTQLKEQGAPLVLVATSDRDLKDSISGAHVVSAEALLREIVKVGCSSALGVLQDAVRDYEHRSTAEFVHGCRDPANTLTVQRQVTWTCRNI